MTVVHELDRHPRAEAAGLDADAGLAKGCAEQLVQSLGVFGSRSPGEARSVPLRRVCDQRELAHDEHLASTSSSERSNLPLLVLEDLELRHLVGQPRGFVLAVLTRDSEEHAEALPDLPHHLAVHAHARLGDALDDRSHAAIIRGL